MADVQKFLQQIADRRAGKIPNTKYATQRDYKTNMAARYEREKRILQHKQGVNTDDSDASSEIKQLDVVYDESGKVTGFKEKNQNNNNAVAPVTVPTYEQYLQRLADTYTIQTVPSKEQIQQYNADSKVLFESEMQEKYKDADYETLKNAVDKTEKYQEKQWLNDKAEEVATSAELQGEKDELLKQIDVLAKEIEAAKPLEQDKLIKQREELQQQLYNLEVNGIDTKINNKKNVENTEEFEKWKNGYKSFTYEELINAKQKAVDDKEKQWLNDYANEIASSEELTEHKDKLKAEYDKLYSELNSYDDEKYDNAIKRMMNIENELEELEGKIKAKRNDEDKQENYSDVIQNDVKANTVLQKYYALKKAEETEKLLKDTGANIADIKTSNAKYYNYAKNMSDDEKAQIVSDFESLKTKGYDVDKLYKYYSREQEEKLTQEQNKILADYAGEHPVLGSVASVGLNLGGGVADAVNYIGTELDSKFNNGDGYINPESTNVHKTQLIRDTVSEDMGGLGKFLYSTGMSMADFLSTAAISAVPGGQTVGLALLGTSAGVNAANDVIESGGDIDHAVMTGIAAGIAETVFEKVSLEQLKAFKQGDVKSVKDFVMNLLKGSFTEGSEEAFTDMANAITDQIINGDMSQLSRQYSEYLASGMSEQEARLKTALDFGKQTLLDFAGGALSGGVMSGGAMGINVAGAKIDSGKNARQIGESAMDSEEFDIDALIDSALKTDKNSKAYKMGQSMMRAKNSGNSKSLFVPVNVGNLIKLTTAEYKKNGKAIQNNSKQQEQSKSTASKKNTEQQKQDTSAQPVKQEKAQTSADIKEWARKKYKFNSEEEKEEFLKILSPFGTKNEKGLVANIYENGKKKLVMVDGIESSSRYYEDANNQITLRLTDGTVMSADDVMFHDNKFQQLVKNAAAFDTMGAQAYVRAYEDYENYAGSKADMTRYSEDFDTMYDVGRAGITYDTFLKSGQYKAIYRSIGEKAARQAIFAGNLDGDYRYRDPKNKMLKVRGVKGNVVVQEGVSFDREKNSEIISLLGSLSEKVGRDVVITNSFDNTNIKGQFNPRTGKLYVSADINTAEMLSIALHEAGHSIKLSAPEEWRELEKFVVNYLTSQNKNVSQMIDEQMEIYRASGQILDKETALEEIVCNSLMSLASDEKALQTAIKSTDKKALKKIADAIRKIAAKIKSWLSGRNAISAEAYRPFMNDIDALMKLAEKFEKAAESGKGVKVEQKNNTSEGVKNYIAYTDDNKPVVVIEDNILDGVPKKDWVKTVKNTISRKFANGIPIKGRLIKVNRITRNEYTNSKNGKYLRDNNSVIYEDKFKSANNLDEIVIASTNYVNEDLKHQRKDNFREFARGDVLIRVGNNDYSAKVIVGLTASKSMVLYDVIDFTSTKLNRKKESTPYGQHKESIRSGMLSNSTIPYKSYNVNNNSMQENENNANNVKYAIDDIIDNNRDLVAIHNLSAKNLIKMISDFDGKGIPAPSIAIDKVNNIHSDFGEISLLFDRNTIDPQFDNRNRVYSRDAWTSMYPKTEFKLNEKAMKKLAERLDMSVNELKSNMFDTSDIQKIKYRFEDDFKVRKSFLKENNIKATPVLRDRQPDIMMFSARAVKKFVRKNDCTFDRLVNDKDFRNELFKAYSDGASLKGIANAHIKETDGILDLAKSEEFYSVLKEKFDYAIEYAKGNVQQTEGSMTEAVNNAIEEYKEEFSSYIDELLSSGVLGEEYIVRDDVDPYDDYGNRKPFSKTHYKYNIENVVKAMKSGRSKVGSSFTGGISYVKSIGAKKLNSIDEIKGNKNRIVPMTEEEIEAENERISDLIKPLIEEVADSGSYNNDFITASNNIVDAFNSKTDVNGVYNYLKQYHNKIKMSTVKKLFAVKAEIENLPTRYFEAKPHRAVSFDEVKAAVIPVNTDNAVKEALKEIGIPLYEYDLNDENSRAEITQKAINTEYIDVNGEKHSDLRFAIDDEYGMFDDLLEGETEEQKAERWHEEFEKYLQYNPEQALLMTYNAGAKTAEQAIKVYDTALDEKYVDRAIRKVWEQYHISTKNEPLGFDDFKKALNEYVADVREDKISYGESFENLVMACREALQLSALEDHNYDDFRAELKAVCKNGLVLNKYEESEIKEIYGSVARYRNALFGKCTVRLERNINSAGGKKTGQYIDDIIADLSNKFGDMVPADMHSLEGLQWFEQLVNKYWQPQYINPYIDGYSEDINTAAIQMAYDMSSAYIAEMSKQIVSNSKADKRQLREVTKLAKKSNEETYKIVKAKEKRIKALAEQNLKIKEKNKEEIAKLKEGKKQEIALIEAKHKVDYLNFREEYYNQKRKTMLRNRLGRMLNSLSKRLDGKANNNEYIPESLKQPILDVLSSFAVDPGKTKYGKQKAVPGYYGEYRRINEIGNAVTRLAQKYSAIDKSKSDNKGKSENQDYAFIDIESLAYKEKTQKALSKLSDQLEGKNIYQLDVYDLEEVVDTMELLDQTLKDAVSVIIDGQKQQITEAATKAVEEIESVKFSKDVQRFGNSMLNNILSTPRELRNAYVATHLDPVRYGKFLSGYHEDSVTYKIFSDLHEGDKKRIRILESAMLEVQRTLAEYDDKEIKALQKNDVAEFDLRDFESGKRIKISQGVLLAIYLTDRQADGHRHMVNDKWNCYTVVPDVDYMNSPITELKGKNSSGDKFHKIRLTQSDIEHINKYVEENRLLKDLAKSISYVYNEMLPEEINAVSMAKYGKRIATVKNYYPLKVYRDGAKFSDKNFEAEFNDIRMKSRGFTKQREFSYASIMIDDVLRTFQRHVGSVSEWCGLLIPIENFKKVYNSGNGMNTMHEAIKKKFGPSAEHYIDKLMGDLQNQRDSVDDNVLVKVQQKYMGAVLMLNPGAAVKQMAAFPLANKYFGHINVAKSTVMGAVKGKELCEIYSKYTPYLWYRAQGNGTIVGETSRQAGFYGKATDALDIMGKMDRYVVNSMLYAAEQHIKKTTDLKPGTEEFYKEVARQYEKVVDESQPNNMITSKPQFVRNNVLKTLSMNAFMSQTMAMGNGLIDSFMEWRARAYDYQVNNKSAESKAAKNEAGKRFLQHCIGVLESAALLSVLSLISAFGYHKGDDFKDENGNVTFDKIKKNMIDYFLDGALGSFAWGKQMYEFIASWATGETYYGLEVMSISNINDIAKDIQKGNFMSLATMVGDCIGLPASNAYRIARSVSAYVNDMMYGNGNIIISNSGFNDVNLDNLPSMIVTALQSGDRDKAEYYENMLKEHLINDNGKSEKEAVDSIKNKIVSILADGDEVGEIAKLKYNGELQEYENRVNKLVAQGFDSVDVKKAVDKAVSNVKADMRENDITDNESATDWLINQGFNEQAAQRISEDYLSYIDDESEEVAGALEDSSENDESTKYAYDDLWNALISGNDDLYNEIYENITTADGKLTDKKDIEKKQKAADSSMKSTSRTDKLWAEYVEAVRGSDPARVKELRNIFIRIYGSWDKALEALKRYKERQKQNQ